MTANKDVLESPNILFILCDQLRIDLLECYGGTRVRTPHIAALAEESVVFDRAYTPCAICSPARASIMTGVYPHRHHMFTNSTPGYSYCEHLRSDIDILPDWIAAETCYESAYFGKWHIGSAEDLFSSSFHHTHPREGDLSFLRTTSWHPNKNMAPMVKSYACGTAGTFDMPMDNFPDVAAANFTKLFLRDKRDTKKPFCAFCSFPGPHSAWIVPDEFGIRYDPAQITLWPNYNDKMIGKPLNQIKLRLLGKRGRLKDLGETEHKEALACLFSYMELIDCQVGGLIEELKRTGLYDNTVIVFTADHGDMAGSHGFHSKGSYMYDETYRIPMLLRIPGQGGNHRIDRPVHLMDLTATIMHLMKGEPVDKMATHELHGSSLLPLIRGEIDSIREVHYAEYHGDWYGHYSARMVTDGKWKLVWNLTDLCELYNLETDPYEMHNLFYNPDAKATRDRYFEKLLDSARQLKDSQLSSMNPVIEDQCLSILQHGF